MVGVGSVVGKQSFYVAPIDERILTAIYDFHFLTAPQLARLQARGSLNYARERLKRLVDAGYLIVFPAPRHSFAGKSAYVYQVSTKAIRYLQDHDYDVEFRRLRPSETPKHDQFVPHTLAVNDFLITARLLERRLQPLVQIPLIRHERDLKRSAGVHVDTAADEAKTFVVPDGWIAVHVQQTDGRTPQFPLWLEVDRCTASVRKIKQKVRGIISYYTDGHYERLFGSRKLKVVFAIDRGTECPTVQAVERRIKDVTRWIEEELTALGKSTWGKTFCVGMLEHTDDVDLFLIPRWFVPYQDVPISLLDLPASDSLNQGNGERTPLAPRAHIPRS